MKPKHFLILVCVMMLGFSGCGVSQEDFDAKVEELESAKQAVVKLEDQLKEKDAKIAELERSRGEDRKKLAALQQEIGSAQKNKETLDKYMREMGSLRSQNASIQQQLTEKAANIVQLQGLLNDKTGVLADLQAQFDKLKLSSLGSTSELSDLKTLVSSKDAALKDKDAQINAKDSELQKKNSQIAELMKQLEALKGGSIPGMGGAGGLLQR
jgi:chromosome segregation ATPase